MRGAIILAALVLGACVADDQIGGDPAPASFVCAGGNHFAVNFRTDGDPQSVLLTFASGETAVLLEEPAASGVRYAWPSDGTGYVFWTKGQEATVYLKDGTRGGEETVLYADCKLQ